MKDQLHNVLNFVDHNRYTVAAAVVFVLTMAFAVSLTGCEAMTPGLTETPAGTVPKVTRAEFQRQALIGEKNLAVRRIELESHLAAFNEEVKAFNDRITAGQQDLQRQDEFKQQLLDTVGLVAMSATEGTLNPAALVPIGIGLLGGALGLGTSADNRRKDSVISALKKASA